MARFEVTINEYDPNHQGFIIRQWPETYEADSYTDAYHQAWEQYRDTPYIASEWSTRKLDDDTT